MALFDEKAGSWDNPERSKMAETIGSQMIQYLSLTKEDIAADYGAGTGLITFQLAPLVKKVMAIDSSIGMISMLNEKIKSMNVNNVETLILDLEKHMFSGRKFDVIASSMTLHHIQDTNALVKKFYDMLNNDGRIAIADLDEEDGTFHEDDQLLGVKHHGFDRNRLKDAFESAGFKHERFETVYTIKRKQKDYPIFLMTAVK
jgi:ubiquinone/menaquinone biosynthesis C-methylase UbiE